MKRIQQGIVLVLATLTLTGCSFSNAPNPQPDSGLAPPKSTPRSSQPAARRQSHGTSYHNSLKRGKDVGTSPAMAPLMENPRLIVFVTHTSTNSDLNVAKIKATLAPFVLKINPDGTVISRPISSMLNPMTNQPLSVLPVCSNNMGSTSFLRSTKQSLVVQKQLVRYSAHHHLAALMIHFTIWHPKNAPYFVKFIQQLVPKLKTQHTQLYVSIPPHMAKNVLQPLGAAATALLLMTYDQQTNETTSKPVAPLSWLDQEIKRVSQYVPAHRLYLGLASYGLAWHQGKITPQNSHKLRSLCRTPTWRADAAEYYCHTKSVTAFWPGQKGLLQKVQLVHKYHLAGVAIWSRRWLNHHTLATLQTALDQP